MTAFWLPNTELVLSSLQPLNQAPFISVIKSVANTLVAAVSAVKPANISLWILTNDEL